MADQIEQLKQLQQVDARLYALRRLRDEHPRTIEQVRLRVTEQEASVKAAEERLTSLQLSQKSQEVELAGREAQLKKLQSQLFQVKTNKEYTAIQHEIETLKADNSLMEEAILRTLDQIDQASGDRRKEAAVLAERQAEFRGEHARLTEALAEVEGDIAQLERERAGRVPDVPAASLRVYERILAIRDGVALAPVAGDSCGGCHRRLPPQVVNEVYLKAKLVMCESCNRILFLNEQDAPL